MRRRDLLLGGSLTALAAADALAQPVPFSTGVFKKTLGPNGGSLGPVTGGANPTIDLNFTTGTTLDSRVTFSRADTSQVATYTDSTGLLRYGPTNLNALSVDNGTWSITGTGTRTANATAAPDGTTTGSLIAADATVGTHGFAWASLATPLASVPYTVSIYAKAGGSSKISLELRVGANWLNSLVVTATFDLSAVTATMTQGVGTAQITSVGNGWYRCSTNGISAASGLGAQTNFLKVLNAAGSENYGGAGESAYFWGVQYEQGGPAPTAYIATTGAVKSGPRFDYSPATVTNFIRNSSMAGGGAGVYPGFWTESHNTAITPTIIGVGTETGIPYVDIRFNGAATAGNNNLFMDGSTVPIQALNGQTWTHSVYLRIVGGSTANLNSVLLVTQQRDASLVSLGGLSTNLVASLNGNALSTNRFTWTATIVQAATANVLPFLQINPATASIDITLRIGAPQLEQSASANTFVPTYGTFAGSGGTLRGLLIEEARTNLAFPSNLPATLFTASASTLTATQGVAPDGTTTMARLAEDATTATHYANKTFTVTASAVYTFSLYAQAQQDTFLQLFYDDGTGVNGCYANFNLSTGAIAQAIAAFGAGTATVASIQSAGNGIYRCSITGVATSSTTGRVGVVLAQVFNASFATVYAGSTANGLLIWGAQFELGSLPTTYIPTVGASVTRAVDNASMALSPPATFSLAAEVMVPVATGTQGFAELDDGTIANRVTLRTTSAVFNATSVVSSAVTAAASSGTPAANTILKAACVSNGPASTITLAQTGVVAAAVAGAQPTGLTTLRMGANQFNGVNLLDGWLRRVRYYPQALTTAQLTQVTT